MRLSRAVGSAVGYCCVTLAALGVLYAALFVYQSAVPGLTAARTFGVMMGLGVALTGGLFGYTIRKKVSGQALPVDDDISTAFWGVADRTAPRSVSTDRRGREARATRSRRVLSGGAPTVPRSARLHPFDGVDVPDFDVGLRPGLPRLQHRS
ncbi:hypothetical protein [Halomarina oriensis]|uniref:Uncharacterized protein n=1 Tax=Halomarina oriensis TaxID=671145 RepID=A0A6B0GM27_9EURY|nr:hypothetical protein [Halomarina oriensis]MWG34747.1 hypothetical protein [Halomarina oriensis]